MSDKQLSFDCAMMIVGEQKWIKFKDIVRLQEFIQYQQSTIERLKRRLDYETRMHKRWKDDCLAILEEKDLNDYVEELQKGKNDGWDSEPNTDYITRVREGLNNE